MSNVTKGKRKRKSETKFTLAEILKRLDSEPLVVTEGGKRKRMPSIEVQYKKLFNQAIKGDLAAAREVIKLANEYGVAAWEPPPGWAPPQRTEFVVVPNQQPCDDGTDE